MSEADLWSLARGLDHAVERGLLPSPAVVPWITSISRNAGDSHAYVRALRSRLVDLGYLGQRGNRDAAHIDPRLIKAVRRFQRDVGPARLAEDGWAGPETWRALQALVSFEERRAPRSWPLDGPLGSSRAVVRAAWLRLWVMGFFGDWQRDRLRRNSDVSLDNPRFADALQRFRTFAQLLDLDAAGDDASLGPDTVTVLFDHDGIVAALSSEKFTRLAGYEREVRAIARIELWLHGYDCEPGPPAVRGRRHGTAGLEPAIQAFWENAGEHRAAVIDPALFAACIATDDIPAAAAQLDFAVGVIDGMNGREQAALVDRLGGLAASVWDGMRRLAATLWRFFRRGQGRGRRPPATMMKNLARLVARQARRRFHLVVRAVDVVQGGVDYLRHTTLPGALPSRVIVHRGADSDRLLLLAGGAGVADGTGFAASAAFLACRRQEALFGAGCIVVGELLAALRDIAAATTGALAGPLWWLRAVLAVGRFRAHLDAVTEALSTLATYRVSTEHAGAVMRVDVE